MIALSLHEQATSDVPVGDYRQDDIAIDDGGVIQIMLPTVNSQTHLGGIAILLDADVVLAPVIPPIAQDATLYRSLLGQIFRSWVSIGEGPATLRVRMYRSVVGSVSSGAATVTIARRVL